MTRPPHWPAPRPRGPVDAVVQIPGSKSLTNRWLVLGALADGPSTIRRPLRSLDTEAMVDALQALGAAVDTSSDQVWSISPAASPSTVPLNKPSVDCGQAGTVMRFVPPLAALTSATVDFHGHPSAATRPVGPVLDALRALGVEVDDDGSGTLPFTVHGKGRVRGGCVEVDASASSQFISALLLAAARFEEGLTLSHSGTGLPSGAHLDMTLQVLQQVGVRVSRPDDHTWRVEPGPVRAFDVTVEPDLSSAAPFMALAAVTGGRVTLPGWPAETTQPGARMRDVLAMMGASCELGPDGLVVRGPSVPDPTGASAPTGLRGTELDLSEIGELTPVVTALAALAQGSSVLSGIAHLRGHETDRLAALVTEVTRLGGVARELPDGLVIEPGPRRGAPRQTYPHPPMAMFSAVKGAAVPGVEVEDIATAAKTYPGFDGAWESAAATGVAKGRP
ncbi:MAG: 3-phosphoshikimate 1-carboxyvinyltransferase [Ornithinimicrobium sp.]|uniref:3-phosphoshikimate 1-carboxyvinyltransferase n=1 Tax=Ornithinimicrobium sp. TaxID=1977084 RepID=UPI0026DEAE28|nr:3-phosphoshikimate 1-carboxyvinyltransferase [Ornithinimicrobium sp.]MDO5738880.1 3-phosphoshikimate 1-carboxyvinyltransferase [Ornithinimicrobium sp.]